MSTRRLSEDESRRAQLFARLTYIGVMVAFLTVCGIAVITTMNIEKNKKGFKSIRVSKPISFIDTTYMVDPDTGRKVKKTAEQPTETSATQTAAE